MLQKISLFRRAIVKRNLIPHIIVTALLTLVYLVNGPISYWRDSIEFKEYGYETFTDLLSSRGYGIFEYCNHSGSLEIIVILAAVMAFINFYYLFDKRTAQTLHAMPFTRCQLFVTSYLKGLIPIVIPPLVTLLCWLLLGTDKLNYLPGPGVLVYEYLLFTVGGMMLYSMAVMLNMICGVWYLAPVLYVIFNYLYLLLKAIMMFAASSVIYGFTYDYLDVLTDPTKKDMILSPRSFLILGCKPDIEYIDINTYAYTYSYRFLWYLIPIVIFTVLAFVAYQRRPIENTGDFLIKRWLKTFFSIGITVCASVVAIYLIFELRNVKVYYNKQIWLNVLIIFVVAFVIYILISALFEKTFLIVRRKIVLIPAFIVAAVMSIFLAGLQTDVIGIGSRLPEEDEVKKASLEIFYAGYRYSSIKNDITVGEDNYSDSTDPAEVIKMHKMFLDNKDYVLETKSDCILYVTVRYLLKDGTVMERAYDLPLQRGDLNDKNSILSYIDEKYNNPASAFNDAMEGRVPVHALLSTYVYTEDYEMLDFELDPEMLQEAVMKDLAAGNLRLVYYDAEWYYHDSPYREKYNVYNTVLRIRYKGGKRWMNSARYTKDEFGTDISPDYSSEEPAVEISFYITDRSENILKFLRESGVPMEKVKFFNDMEETGTD
ncbi:MAG: hypothetical protein IJK13_03705 [Lachnospiraceae bacterium]|nr:hypothetical protein [Lachnospiraceae bacterium]